MGGRRFPGPTLREVCSPLIDEDLAPLVPEHTTVQISSRLTDDEFRRLADFMADYPEVRLRVYGGYDGSITDLDFLRFFPRLRRFSVDAIYELPSLDGIGLLSDELEDLLIGWTRSKRFSLRNLTNFRSLRTLYLEGQQKDFAAIGELEALEDLTLRSITLPDLSALVPLRRLTSLDIKLGGTRDVSLLPQIRSTDLRRAVANPRHGGRVGAGRRADAGALLPPDPVARDRDCPRSPDRRTCARRRSTR